MTKIAPPQRQHVLLTACLLLSLLALILPPSTNSIAIPAPPQIGDFAKSISDAAGGLMRQFPNVLPRPEDFFSASKNLLAGYPVEMVLNTVNLICSAALSAQSVQPKQTPALERMNFVLMTRTANASLPLREAHRLWHHAAFNASRPTAVLVTGWTSNVNKSNTALGLVFEAYMCRGGYNFVAIDTAEYVDTLYEWAAFNTDEIGKLLASALHNLTESYPIERIHLIGHSLGAHIVGSAGREYQQLSGGTQLPRITGLDPANPCFNEGYVLSGLSRGDAKFVDVIHSNPGALGKRDPLGDVDFYPNGLDPLPPGCYSIGCAHGRAYEYYAETVYPGNENALMGVKCQSMFALNAGFCRGRRAPMGFATTPALKGDYFLKTNAESPFGEDSQRAVEVQCNEEDGTGRGRRSVE